ncbi:MAG: hypothetical protein U9R08_02845 [Nanoarchaeota archaeon]|nr:hypothetical protein [Nanoarchaeota archaeon]
MTSLEKLFGLQISGSTDIGNDNVLTSDQKKKGSLFGPEEVKPITQKTPLGELFEPQTVVLSKWDELLNQSMQGPIINKRVPAVRNNNPGNVKIGGIADRFALKDANGNILTDENDHLRFPDIKSGFQGITADVWAKINGGSDHIEGSNPTIAEIGRVYATDSEPWIRNVSNFLEVDPNTRTKSVDFDELLFAISKAEGFFNEKATFSDFNRIRVGDEEAVKEIQASKEKIDSKIDPALREHLIRVGVDSPEDFINLPIQEQRTILKKKKEERGDKEILPSKLPPLPKLKTKYKSLFGLQETKVKEGGIIDPAMQDMLLLKGITDFEGFKNLSVETQKRYFKGEKIEVEEVMTSPLYSGKRTAIYLNKPFTQPDFPRDLNHYLAEVNKEWGAKILPEAIEPVHNLSVDASMAMNRALQRFVLNTPYWLGGLIEMQADQGIASLLYGGKLTEEDKKSLPPSILQQQEKAEAIDKRISEVARNMAVKNRDFLTKSGYFSPPESSFVKWTDMLTSGGASLATAIALTALTKQPQIAGVVFGAMQTGSTYSDIGEDYDVDTKFKIALTKGVLEGALEWVGLEIFFKNFKKPALNILVKTFNEAFQEGSQEFGGNLIDWYTWDPNQKISEGVMESMVIGGLLGFGSSGITVLLEKTGVHNDLIQELKKTNPDKTDIELKEILNLSIKKWVDKNKTEMLNAIKDSENWKLKQRPGFIDPSAEVKFKGEDKLTKSTKDDIKILDKEIVDKVEKFRKEAGYTADKKTAGVKEYKTSEGTFRRWSLKEAKKDMSKMAEQGKQYAKRELYENDEKFRALVDKRDILYEQIPAKEIDIDSLFRDINNQLKQDYGKKVPEVGRAKETTLEVEREVKKVEIEQPITKPSLTEQAKKYKSADEFEKNIYYHGTADELKGDVGEKTLTDLQLKKRLTEFERHGTRSGEGLYLSSQGEAFNYASNFYDNPVVIGFIKSPGAKIQKVGDYHSPEWVEFESKALKAFPSLQSEEAIVKYAKKIKVDGLDFGEKEGLLVINPTKFTKIKGIDFRQDDIGTKQQLKEIWEKAQKIQEKSKAEKEKYLKGITSDIIKKIHSKLNNKAYIKSITKKETKAVQIEVINALEQSDLDAHDKAKFIRAIKNIQTIQQLESKLPEILERIERLEKKATIRRIKDNIRNELKDIKIKKVNGKPVGKFTPEIQRILDTMKRVINLTQDEAELKIIDNINQYPDIPPVDVALENAILKLISTDLSIAEMGDLLSQIKDMKEKGKMMNVLKKFNIQTEIQREKELLISRITGEKGIKVGIETFGIREGKIQRIKQTFKSLGKRWILDWQGKMRTLDFNNHVENKILAEKFSTLEQDNKYKELELEFVNDFNDAISEAYNIKNKNIDIHKQLLKLSKKINLGTITNTEGVEGELILTKDEIIKRWMEFQDPTLLESFTKGNKFTSEMREAIEGEMTDNDKIFARNQFEMYKKQWNKINPIYSEIYGVDLSFNEFYSPIRREGYVIDATKGMGEFLIESGDRRALSSDSFKIRVGSILPITGQSSIETLKRHITETNYFVAWVKQIRRFKANFSDHRVRSAIKQEFGDNMLVAISNSIKDFTNHGNKNARRYKVVDYFRKKFTLGALAIKVIIGTKQMVSTIAYLEKLNPIEFTVGVSDFWLHPVKNWKILENESIFFKTRGQNMERDIKAAQESNIFKEYSRTKSFMDMLMLNVKIGDKGAIAVGSWALRKARLKQGQNINDIIKEYEEFSSATQQSADISRLSEVQRGGSLDQLFTMFKSSPRQYLQKEVMAIKSLFEKGGFGKKNIGHVAKTLAIYHVLIPLIFQYVANLGGWDDEDKKEYLRAGILGSLNGLFIFGDIVDSIIRTTLGLRVWDLEVPVATIANDINKAIRKIDFDDITSEDVFSALFQLIDAGNVFGVPAKQTKNMVGGIGDIFTGQSAIGISRLLGWSPRTAEKKFEEDRKSIVPKLKPPLKLKRLKLKKLPKLKLK